MLSAQAQDLAALSAAGRGRSLAPQRGRDFSSNDYLGLAASDQLADAARAALDRGIPVGSGGSRLLRGNHPEHEALEAEAAAFFGGDSALFFPTGFTANSALLSTLPQRGDLILYDELVHASAHEGMRLSRAETCAVPHNDVDRFAEALAGWRAGGGRGQAWIVVESLYSMDGDQAPLADLAAVAARHEAMLVIDEAHASGVFGAGGRGVSADLRGDNVITLHTLGKALGCEGALLCAPRVVCDFLINRGRGFIFSTAPSPLVAAVARKALRICEAGDDLRADLWARVHHAETVLAGRGVTPTGSQILALILHGDEPTMRAAAALQARGFDVRGIRPPTVPEGRSRLRIAITRNVLPDDIDALGAALAEIAA